LSNTLSRKAPLQNLQSWGLCISFKKTFQAILLYRPYLRITNGICYKQIATNKGFSESFQASPNFSSVFLQETFKMKLYPSTTGLTASVKGEWRL
jgi:hypothetical protein